MSATKNRLTRLEAMAASLPVELLCNCDRSGKSWKNTTAEAFAAERTENRHGMCERPLFAPDAHARFMRDVRGGIYGDD
ncbi:MAG: hypothetical protein SF097_04630 [Acidobacteriota bacterium]|nr:hypothetical protein [Acidobacteriota bacterium]